MKWFNPGCAAFAKPEESSMLVLHREEVKIGFPYLAVHIEIQPGILSLHRLPSDDNVPW